MRKVTFAIFALAALGIGSFAGTAPASAHDYPWCAQGKGYGYPGECAYQTLEQCRASVSGRLLTCGVNPMVAFNQQRRQPRNSAPY
jgi:Protein of unknown function (DUF3551)